MIAPGERFDESPSLAAMVDRLQAKLDLAIEALHGIMGTVCLTRCCLCKVACCPAIFAIADETLRELDKP